MLAFPLSPKTRAFRINFFFRRVLVDGLVSIFFLAPSIIINDLMAGQSLDSVLLRLDLVPRQEEMFH